MPGYDALNDLMNALDPNAYARAPAAWLQANNGILPRSLSLDGKTIGDGKCGMIVTLCRHEDGRPVAMIPATGEKEDCEVSEARTLLADPVVRLENALVTADPLHNKQTTLRVIAEKGGGYLVGAKANTSKRLEAAEVRLKDPPFCPELRGEHGRIDSRAAAASPIEPTDVGLPSARCVLKVRREWEEAAKPGDVHEHIRYFITSVEADRDRYLGRAVRGHWSIENRNHHKRDDSVWQEDRHRHRRINVAQNPRTDSNALLAIIPFTEKHNLPSFIADYQDDKTSAIHLILHAKPIP